MWPAFTLLSVPAEIKAGAPRPPPIPLQAAPPLCAPCMRRCGREPSSNLHVCQQLCSLSLMAAQARMIFAFIRWHVDCSPPGIPNVCRHWHVAGACMSSCEALDACSFIFLTRQLFP